MNIILKNNSYFILFFVLVLVSSFAYYPNMGSEGLYVPFNTTVWLSLLPFVVYGINAIVSRQSISISKSAMFFILMPFVLIFSGLVTAYFVGVSKPLSWMLRVSAIFLITAFFLSCFQFSINRSVIEKALFFVCVALFFHAVVAFIQFIYPGKIFYIMPHVVGNRITGMFQQPNTLASAMVLAIVIVLYLLSMPSFKNKSRGYKLTLLLVILTTSFVVMITGSRVGVLGLMIALPIMLLARYRFIFQKGLWAYLFLIAIISGLGFGSWLGNGIEQAFNKIENFTSDRGDIRTHVYSIGYKTFLERPILGHGIGSFEIIFHQKAADYQADNGGVNLIGQTRYTHPHNEPLLWAIEGGVLAVLAFFLGGLAIVNQACKVGWARGGAYLSLLLPIFLHTQVEHPFYISTLHLFLFVFILFVFLKHGSKAYKLSISYSAAVFVKYVLYLFLVLVLIFCSTALYFGYRMSYVLFSGHGKVSELELISRHPYFSKAATRSMLKFRSEFEIENDNVVYMKNYAAWLEEYLLTTVDISAYAELIRLYSLIDNKDKLEVTIKKALFLFPENDVILNAISELE